MLSDIIEIINDDDQLLAFLQFYKLILEEKSCHRCSTFCYVVKSKDKFLFQCPNKACRTRFSACPSTFWLYNSKLPYSKLLPLIYLFVQEGTVTQMSSIIGISKTSTIGWIRLCREVCIIDCISNSCQIGGEGKIVEVIECVFGKRSYNKGTLLQGRWVLGGIEKGSKKYFLTPVENSDSDNLSQLIIKNIKPGSTIISDSWKDHKDLDKINFGFLADNYSITFKKDKTTDDHTNMVESTWSQVKLKIRTSGRVEKHLVGYLATFMWFQQYDSTERFEKFLGAIYNNYH